MWNIDWLWLTAGLIGGISLCGLLAYWLSPSIRWDADQRRAVTTARAQLAALHDVPTTPTLDNYRCVTTPNGTALRVIEAPSTPLPPAERHNA